MIGMATVYLIHFEEPYRHARHYLGVAVDLEERLRQHHAGTKSGGARLMEVVSQAGIAWRVVRVWEGGRGLERRLKRWHGSARLCPICQAERKSREAKKVAIAS